MRLLLDTHALLWLVDDDPRLSRAANRAIDDPTADLVVSPVSAYEIGLKHALGKLPGATQLVVNFGALLREHQCSELAVTIAHAHRAGTFDLIHRDPFDRILAAQAIIEDAAIVSADPAFDALGAKRIW